MQLKVNDLMQIIGEQHVEVRMLRQMAAEKAARVTELEQENQRLAAQISADQGEPA